MAAKMTTATVTTLAAAVVWMFSTFETASGADQKWDEHNRAVACAAVNDLRAEIRKYRELMRREGKNLSEEDKEYYEGVIADIKADIERLDTDGNC